MIKYNPKHYDKVFQSEAIKWWRTLSINEQKAYEKKYSTIMGSALKSEIAAIYDGEGIPQNPT